MSAFLEWLPSSAPTSACLDYDDNVLLGFSNRIELYSSVGVMLGSWMRMAGRDTSSEARGITVNSLEQIVFAHADKIVV